MRCCKRAFNVGRLSTAMGEPEAAEIMLTSSVIAASHRPHFSKAVALLIYGVERLPDGVGEHGEEFVGFLAGG